MKICAYVQTSYAKPVYKTECFNVRAWVGMSVIIDVLNRAGYQVEYAGKDTVHQYDIVLVSLTSDCDWWQFISERVTWRKGNYKVIIGGAGLLNIRPFREYADCFIFGRGENLIVPVVEALAGGDEYSHESVAYRETFSVDSTYKIAQVDAVYPHEVGLENGKIFREDEIGCPHKCFFCGYSWQRKYCGRGTYTDTSDDWCEFLDIIREIDATCSPGKQWGIILHSTPFRAMPATPLACAPMSYKNYRGEIARVLGKGKYKGNIFYQGNKFWAVEGMGTDSLSTHALSAICHRGTEKDADNARKVACNRKFWNSNSAVKQATIEKYFDVDALFGRYTWDTLPTRYLHTYANIPKMIEKMGP